MVSIWFFIGISLLVNGALILAAGIFELVNPPANPSVVLFSLHANVWWGAILFALGRSTLFISVQGASKRSAFRKTSGIGAICRLEK